MTRYFSPLPCSVYPEVLAAQAVPPGSSALVSAEVTAARMKEFFFLDAAEVLFYPGVRFTGYQMVLDWFAGKRILLFVNGTMSQEWLAVAADSGVEVTVFDIASGAAFNANAFNKLLDGNAFDAVMMVQTDVYTGTTLRVDMVSSLLRQKQSEALLLVDCSASVFAEPLLSMSKAVDVYLCCSDMSMGLPPGLLTVAISPRAHTRIMGLDPRQWIFNYSKQYISRKENKFFAAAPYPLINALNAQMDRVLLEGIAQRSIRIVRLRQQLRAWATAHGFRFVAEEDAAAPNVSALILPDPFTADAFCAYLKDYGLTVKPGAGEYPNTVLVAHGNDVTEADLQILTGNMERFLTDYDTRGTRHTFRAPFGFMKGPARPQGNL